MPAPRRDASLMQLAARACPICASDHYTLFSDSKIDRNALGDFAFASRKMPEFMHYRLVKCTTCALVYANPAPDISFLQENYQASSFDSSNEAAYAAKTYAGYLPETDKGKVLDIGSGGGEFLSELQQAGWTEFEGIEPSGAALATARDDIKRYIRHGMFDAAHHQDNSYALVSCFQTLEHVRDPLAMSKAIYTLLKKGGMYYSISHNIDGRLNGVLGESSPIYDIEHLQLFSPASLRFMLETAGFSDICIFSVWNRYPLHYWVKLLPLPVTFKKKFMAFLKVIGIGYIPVALPVGNMAAVARK